MGNWAFILVRSRVLGIKKSISSNIFPRRALACSTNRQFSLSLVDKQTLPACIIRIHLRQFHDISKTYLEGGNWFSPLEDIMSEESCYEPRLIPFRLLNEIVAYGVLGVGNPT